MQLVSENRPTAPTAALIISAAAAAAVTIMQMTAGEVLILGAVGAMAKKFGGGQLPFWPNQWARGQ
jgi:hypothetical protein